MSIDSNPGDLKQIPSSILFKVSCSVCLQVVVSSSGVVLTNAHLLVRPTSSPHELQPRFCSVRVPVSEACSPVASGSSSVERGPSFNASGTAFVWLTAQVLYLFRNHLDIVVLQLLQSDLPIGFRLSPLTLESSGGGAAWRGPPPTSAVPPARSNDLEGRKVLVLGHGLLGPSTSWPAMATQGNICKERSIGALPRPLPVQVDLPRHRHLQVVCSPESSKPTMLITTAAVHSGSSGGAVVDAATGRLLGLVTSNARHQRIEADAAGSRRPVTLPRLNFSIASEELRPIVGWAEGLPPLPLASTFLGTSAEMRNGSCKSDAPSRVQSKLAELVALDRPNKAADW